MGLEERNGRLYYHRKERIGDRVRSVYMGGGPLALGAADLMDEERVLREMKRKRLVSIRDKGKQISEAYGTLDRYIRLHVSVCLVLEGYRCHKRQWRQSRYPLRSTELMPKKKKAKVPKGNVPVGVTFGRGNTFDTQIDHVGTKKEDVNDAIDLIARCNTANPDADDLMALRKWMERDGVMLRAEELARAVHVKSVGCYHNAFADEAALAGVKDLMVRMGYEEADPVEQLLICRLAQPGSCCSQRTASWSA